MWPSQSLLKERESLSGLWNGLSRHSHILNDLWAGEWRIKNKLQREQSRELTQHSPALPSLPKTAAEERPAPNKHQPSQVMLKTMLGQQGELCSKLQPHSQRHEPKNVPWGDGSGGFGLLGGSGTLAEECFTMLHATPGTPGALWWMQQWRWARKNGVEVKGLNGSC